MRAFTNALLLAVAATVASAASWSFEDATLTVKGKGIGVEPIVREKFSVEKTISKPVTLGPAQSLKILLTATNGKKARKPDQAFLTIADPTRDLEESFPFTLKDTGKATVEIKQDSIPTSLLTSSSPLTASIIIASFGTSTPISTKAFTLSIDFGSAPPPAEIEPPVRYGKQSEIHHVFRSDPKSPPRIITLVFLGAALATVPALFIAWVSLGANLNHLSKAMGAAPIAHLLFLGSVVAIEGAFFKYYTSWNLFQTLPVAGGLAAVAFVSGSRALTEVQERRLAGLR